MFRKRVCLTLAVVVGLATTAWLGHNVRAFIDPKFTPDILVNNAGMIFVGEMNTESDAWRLKDVQMLKGEKSGSPIIGLKQCKSDDLQEVRKLFSENGVSPVILLAGTYNEESRAYLHVNGAWLSVKAGTKDRWEVEGLNSAMSGTFAGGTDMLIRLTRHILAHPDDPVAPTAVGAKWGKNVRIGTVPGTIAGMANVELKGENTPCLFVASTEGDRLFRPKKGEDSFDDISAEAKLGSRSRQFVWTDTNCDGLPDLVSWDGKSISVWQQLPDGAFALAEPAAFSFDGECLGMAAIANVKDGAPAIVVSTTSIPFLISRDGNKWIKTPLPMGHCEADGQPSTCIVADLDNDGYADVLQPRESCGILWKGSPDGLSSAVRINMASGGGVAKFALGDFDLDGLLDVFLCGEQKSELWENNGKAGFKAVKTHAGSLCNKAPGGAVGCIAADLNHDGRPDLALLYSDKSGFIYHFNRGFRCMGEEGGLDLNEVLKRPGEDPLGLQAGAVADFDDDGSQDLAVALSNGAIYCFFNDSFDNAGVRVRLQKGAIGPVTVSVWKDGAAPVCYGTLPVAGYSPGAYFAVPNVGEYVLKWSEPGKPNLSTKATVATGTLDFVLGQTTQTPTGRPALQTGANEAELQKSK